MRRIFTAALGIFLSCSLLGCDAEENASSQSGPLTEQTTAANTETAARPPLPLKSADVEKNILEKTIPDEDGSTLIEAVMQLPALKTEGAPPAAEKISAYFKAQSDAWFSKLGGEIRDAVKADKAADPELFTVYTTDLSFEVTYDRNGFLSILQFEYINAGSAHPNSLRQNHTFSLESGELLGPESFLKGTPEEIRALAAEGFKQMIAENPESYFDNAREIAAQTPPDGFYLGDGALVFYYQTDVIAPYAAGYPQFSIPYSDQDKFLADLSLHMT